MKRRTSAVLGAVVALVSACGVASEDTPQPIEVTPSRTPEATPSVGSETGPAPTVPATPSKSPPSTMAPTSAIR